MSQAAFEFVRHYTRSGGTLIWRTSGGAKTDDYYPKASTITPCFMPWVATNVCAILSLK